MIEGLVLGTETEVCGVFNFWSGYILQEECMPEVYRSTGMQGEWCKCVHMKICSICVYCYCEPHLVKVTGTASLAD